MGNQAGKIKHCFAGDVSRRHELPAGMFSDEGLGHSFCYIRPDQNSSLKIHSEEESSNTIFFPAKTFRSISGASVSANTSTPPSTALIDICNNSCDRASAFESSTSFASIPLQPVPRISGYSGGGFSGPLERGFLSGPIERGFVSGPIDRGLFSGPIDKVGDREILRSVSVSGVDVDIGSRKFKKQGVIKSLRRAISSTISRGGKSLVSSFKGVKGGKDYFGKGGENVRDSNGSGNFGFDCDGDDDDGDFSMKSQNLQWAQGKAGEDRVHVVISEQYGWVFVGIYDGFNGPDAPDYLLSNLYNAVHKELKGLLWNERFESSNTSTITSSNSEDVSCSSEDTDQPCLISPHGNGDVDLKSDLSRMQAINSRTIRSSPVRKREENQMRWKGEWNRERMELGRKLNERLNIQSSNGMAAINHDDVLNALKEALRKTEDAYLDMADKMVTVNPELALMGSCVLAMLMKGEDIYLMNVGDSRAVLAQKAESDLGFGKIHQDLGRIKEESFRDLEEIDADELNSINNLASVQLTVDHSSYVEEEVLRIRNEHLDDASAILNDRVKGYLKVTRAFGAGFLKQPKWNDALLEMFRIDYVGTSPYINCEPYIYHHRLGPRDRFLILSSDGLYQYFTNEEAVAEVESFISSFPEGDPAQHLIEEVLFRAAKKAGIDFHELIDIPQGDRRRYHDDVSIIIISFEGRIWRSSV